MKYSQFTDQQIAFAVQQAEAGVAVEEVCRKLGVSQQAFYRWKKKFAGLGVAEVRRLKLLEEENKKLKALAADLSLDKQILQDVLSKKLSGLLVAANWSAKRKPATGSASGRRVECSVARVPASATEPNETSRPR